MPLPPPTPTGGLSSGPFTRTEHTYEWQISDSFLRELASHDGVASTPGSGRWESATATEEETLNLPEIWEENAAMLLTDDEAELVMSGQAFLKRSMPERLGRTFVDAVKQRHEFASEAEYTAHLKRNEHLNRYWVREKAKKADDMRSARIRTQETQARERGRLAEKEAKFQKRHGYTAGLFPGLPDFKMPKNADLEKRLARLDRQCLKQLEARAKAARNVKLKEEVTYRKLYSIASAAGLAGSFRPINYVPKGKLASKTCGRSPRAFMEPVAPTQKGSQALARDLAAPRSPSLLGSTAASKGARPKHHRVDNAAGGSRPASQLVHQSGKSLQNTLLYQELRKIVEEAPPDGQDGGDWLAVLHSDSRPREHAQDSLLPVLDEAPLQMFAKQHEDYEKHSKDWRTTMKDRIRSRIMAAARSRDEENIDLGASLEKNYKPWLENNVALKKNLCRSRLTVAEQYMYRHLNTLQDTAKEPECGESSQAIHALQSAKSTAINIKMKAIMGKEDPEIDSLSRSFWRQSSFPWRQVLEFREHGTPPRPIDLWTTLQLLYVQFDSPSPLAGRPTATQVAKIEQLERESRRIEGLFTTSVLDSGLPQADKDAQEFVLQTEMELKKLKDRFKKGSLAGPVRGIGNFVRPSSTGDLLGSLTWSRQGVWPLQPPEFGATGSTASPSLSSPLYTAPPSPVDHLVRGAAAPDSRSSSPESRSGVDKVYRHMAEVMKLSNSGTAPYEGTAWEVFPDTHEQVWLNHLNLTLCQLAAAIVWLCHPSQRLGIRKLCLADNGLDDVAFSLLLDGMEGTMSIEHLDVSRNRLKSASGVLLGQHMMSGNCTNLLELNISHNRLGDKGAEALLDAISHSQNNILSFAMSDAGTTERLSEKCAACITSNIRVRHLDFSANLMGLRGGFCLGDALRTNGKLVRVDLSGCGFGDEGGMALVAGLDAAVSMKWLGLRQNRLGLKTAEHLSEVLQSHPMPNLVIQMGENPLGRRGACVLLRANASKCVKLIDIQKAALRDNQQPKLIDDSIDGGGLPPACPVYHPSRASFVYRLDLAKADHREVLMKLLRVHARDGPETWHEAYLDSRPITMNDQLCQKWLQGPSPEALASLARMKETELSKKLDEKARKAKKVAENHSKQAQGMPVEGYFVVDLRTPNTRFPEDVSRALDDNQFRPIWQAISDKSASDEWILSYLDALPEDFYFSSTQVRTVIGRLTWPSERVAAAACLLPRVVDPENFDSIVGYELPAEEQEQLDDRLGISRRLDKKNLTGHYELDLAHTVDALIAARLLSSWAVEARERTAATDEYRTCWRNVAIAGVKVDALRKSPWDWKLPRHAKLVVDYVSSAASPPIEVVPQPRPAGGAYSLPQFGTLWDAAMVEAMAMELVKDSIPIFEELGLLVAYADGEASQAKAAAEEKAVADATSEFERALQLLQDLKAAGGSPKAALKQASAQVTQCKHRALDLRKPVLMRKMIRAALDRIPNGTYEQLVPGLDPTLVPEVQNPERAEAPRLGAKDRKKPKEEDSRRGGKDGQDNGGAADLSRLMKVKDANHDRAMKAIRSVTKRFWLSVPQVDLLACLFDRNGHKAEVVVLCFDRIVDKSAFGALLRVLPEAARVEVCQRLGWNNLYDSLYPLGHYVLDLEMMDDVKVLQKLLDLNMRLSEGEANQVYGANEEGSILRSLAFNGQPISGPIACVELFEYLMRLHRAVPSTKEDPAPSPSQRTTRIPDNDGNDGDEGGEDPDGTEKVVQAWGRYGNMMAELDIVFTAGLAKQLRTERDALLPMYQAKRTISFPKDDLG